jgi:site-specific recombinase XerC
MLGRKAKLLSPSNVDDLLAFASTTRYPVRNRAMVLLSVKAGLRAGEIANLSWDMVLEPAGDLGTVLELCDGAAKKRSGRQNRVVVRQSVCSRRPQRLLVAFRTAHIHHASGSGRSPGGRVTPRRAAACWASIVANHRAVHRR